MSQKHFKDLAKQALDSTKKGLDLLCEIHELQQGSKLLSQEEDFAFLVEEIIRKEKLAVSLINEATFIERDLMKSQHQAVEEIINRLSK